MRRFSDRVAVATAVVDNGETGTYLVEGGWGAELVQIIAVREGLCLARDGRGFPAERAHYVVAIVQALDLSGGERPSGDEREIDGYTGDQGK